VADKPPEFLIEGILPANEVHLLGGSSGSGKTTLVFQTLADWQDGLPVWGHESYPAPYSNLSLDRSRSSVTRTLERLDLANKLTRILCQEHFKKAHTVADIVNVARKEHSDSTFFIIEGFQTLAGDKGNSYAPVANLLRNSASICSDHGITILGVTHSPKMKVDESFQHSRELILGSVAWGAYSDTIITVQLDEATGNISVRVSPRNAPAESFHYVFGQNGVLVPLAAAKPKDALKLKVEAMAAGCSVFRSDIVGWAKALNSSERTADRAITECLKNKVLTTIEAGIYERTDRVPLKIAPDNDITVEG
jgi:RecA-family ATPase